VNIKYILFTINRFGLRRTFPDYWPFRFFLFTLFFCFFCFVFIFRCFWNLISNYYKLFIFNLIWINSLLFNYGCFYISSGKIGISLSKTLYTSGQSIS
jgi:hypothetical protein